VHIHFRPKVHPLIVSKSVTASSCVETRAVGLSSISIPLSVDMRVCGYVAMSASIFEAKYFGTNQWWRREN